MRCLVIFAACVFPMLSFGQLPEEMKTAEDELRRSMEVLKAALLKRDSVVLTDILSADLTYGHSNGWTQNKSDFIRSVLSGEQEYILLEPRDIRIRNYGNAAVVDFESLVAVRMKGDLMRLDLDILMVWIREGGTWRLVARQSAKNN